MGVVSVGGQPEVLIIGGGPGGLASFIWAKRLGLKALLLEKEPELGGQLPYIYNRIIDYPGLPVDNGQELKKCFVDHVRPWFDDIHCGAEVRAVDVAVNQVVVQREDGQAHVYTPRFVILAMGARPRRLGVPGEDAMLARGETYSAARDRHRFRGQKVAVIGGGDRALEGALLLAEAGAHVLLIHRRDRFTARAEYVRSAVNHRRIHMLTEATVQRIVGERRLEGIVVRLKDKGAKSGAREQFYPVDALFVRIGTEPNSQLVRGQLTLDADGYIVVDATMQTSVGHVFAVGDVCTRPLYSSISMATAQGMAAAKTIVARLAE